jgi:hypothetical protein
MGGDEGYWFASGVRNWVKPSRRRLAWRSQLVGQRADWSAGYFAKWQLGFRPLSRAGFSAKI